MITTKDESLYDIFITEKDQLLSTHLFFEQVYLHMQIGTYFIYSLQESSETSFYSVFDQNKQKYMNEKQ